MRNLLKLSVFGVLSLVLAEKKVLAEVNCQLSPRTKIRFGCTHGCASEGPGTIRSAVIEAAKSLGYREDAIEFVLMDKAAGVESNLSLVDAIFSPGGHDFNPKYVAGAMDQQAHMQELFLRLGNKGTPETPAQIARDEFEAKLQKVYQANGSEFRHLPFLGICYGMQMLGASVGVPLYEDIYTEIGVPNRRNLLDRIYLDANSKLGPWTQSYVFDAAEDHHQALNADYIRTNPEAFASTLAVTGYSNDLQIVEAIELKHRSAIGIQFHPEITEDFKVRTAPFKWLLNQACENLQTGARTSVLDSNL